MTRATRTRTIQAKTDFGLRVRRPEAASRLERALKFVSHRKARLLLSKAWDKEISKEEARLLAHHLKHCEECSPYAKEMLSFLEQVESMLGRAPTAAQQPPPSDSAAHS